MGGAGNDTLGGGGGDDVLDGGEGRDTLWGGAGDDRLTGGAGDDQISGGAGADVFVFAPGHGRDTVTDFDALDRLDLSGLAAFATPEDVLAAATTLGADLLIETEDGTAILLRNLGVSDIGAENFVV
jgi:Ca2+-binding RTX toxin-like protein